MTNDYNTLTELIEFMSEATGAGICIHDFSGILATNRLKVERNHLIHSTDFCKIAKSTPRGFWLCMKCKTLANNTAISKKELFCGHCPNGIFEITVPICVNHTPVCILYMGNITFDIEQTLRKIEKTCLRTGVDAGLLKRAAEKNEAAHPEAYYIKAAKLTAEYIRFMIDAEKDKLVLKKSSSHVIQSILDYISCNYDKNLTLKTMSKLYFMNEKYLGRLFKKDFNMSFHQYINLMRITRATELLTKNDKSIIDISSECGFNDVTYFNRVFKKHFSLTPVQYRKMHSENKKLT